MRLLLTSLKLGTSIQLQVSIAMANFFQRHLVENETTPRRTTIPETSNDPGTGISIVALYQDIVVHRRVTLSMMLALGHHSLPNHLTGPIPEMDIHNLLVATDCRLMGAWFRMTRYRRPATTQDTIARLINIDWVAMMRICRHHHQSGSASVTQATTVIENGSNLEKGASNMVDVSVSANAPVQRAGIGLVPALAHRHGLARGRDHGLLPPIVLPLIVLMIWMTSNMSYLGCSDQSRQRSGSCTSHLLRSHGQRLIALSGKHAHLPSGCQSERWNLNTDFPVADVGSLNIVLNLGYSMFILLPCILLPC